MQILIENGKQIPCMSIFCDYKSGECKPILVYRCRNKKSANKCHFALGGLSMARAHVKRETILANAGR